MRNSMIININCDKNGEIETSVPTTIERTIYTVDGVLSYIVIVHLPYFVKTFRIIAQKLFIDT